MHCAHAVVPVNAAYVPAGQVKQTIVPVKEVYVPVEQGVHTLAPAPEYWPVGQLTHAVEAVAPVVDKYVPAAQLVQPDEPDVVE